MVLYEKPDHRGRPKGEVPIFLGQKCSDLGNFMGFDIILISPPTQQPGTYRAPIAVGQGTAYFYHMQSSALLGRSPDVSSQIVK